ncbi:MAG: ROK family transcriptional regulator [Veillonellales bacterium]
MTKKPGNSKYVKKFNRMTVLNVIKDYEPVSRHQLSEQTGLTPPAITGIVRELIDLGFVKEVGLGTSKGGRRPIKLKFNCKAGNVIGIEVTSREAVLSVADLKNIPTAIQAIGVNMSEPELGVQHLVSAVRNLMDKKHHDKKFLGIGLAFPGLLNVKEGMVRRSINLGPQWNGFPVKQALETELNLPVFIENNSNASVLAERWFGAGVSCKDLVYINLGEGISAGIIIADQILQGYQGYAGEIGHIVVVEDGALCNCGNRGCLEAICGIPAVVGKAKSELPLIDQEDPLKKIWQDKGEITIDDILKSAARGIGYAADLIDQVGRNVGLVTANLINVYNPEVVFLGGKMAVDTAEFMNRIRETVNTHAFPEVAAATKIRVSALGRNSASIGACALALKGLFQSSNSMLLEDADVLTGDAAAKS